MWVRDCFVYRFFVSVLLVFLMSCSTDKLPEDLESAINEYYSLEKAEDWSAAYEMRSNSFSNVVNKERYIRTMEVDNEGWDLHSWEIRQSRRIRETVIEVEIRFEESFSGEAQSDNEPLGGDDRYVQEWTKWILEADGWTCYDCGSRFRLSMNSH